MKERRGFTIVDILVTIIIIGIMASIMIPKFQSAHRQADLAARAELIYIYNRACQRFQNDTDLYPSDLSDLAATAAPANGLSTSGVLTPMNSSRWNGPYVSAVANDPITGAAFTYNKTGTAVGSVAAPPESGGTLPGDGTPDPLGD